MGTEESRSYTQWHFWPICWFGHQDELFSCIYEIVNITFNDIGLVVVLFFTVRTAFGIIWFCIGDIFHFDASMCYCIVLFVRSFCTETDESSFWSKHIIVMPYMPFFLNSYVLVLFTKSSIGQFCSMGPSLFISKQQQSLRFFSWVVCVWLCWLLFKDIKYLLKKQKISKFIKDTNI